MKRLMRYKTLQCFLAALIMIAFLAPAAYASGTPDAHEASANAVSEKYIGKTVPGACVVISEHDNTVFAKGYGFADLENNTAIDPETTVFEWGSISKTFVWVSVMQLVEDRKIDLETDICTYLPDSFLKNLRFAEPVTLLHLMVRVAIQNFLKNPVISMVFGHPNRKISCISPHIRATVLKQPPFFCS